jgi:hypothetical protein
MHIRFVCPSCGHKTNVPDSFAGKKVKCVKCSALAPVPEPAPGPEAPAAPAAEPAPADVPFTCPSCGAHFEVSADLAGKTIRCRECEEWERVPPRPGEGPAAADEVTGVAAAATTNIDASGSHTPHPTEEETVYYRRHGVLVTDRRVATEAQTHWLADVTAARAAWREVLEYRFRPLFAALCVVSVLGMIACLVGTLSAGASNRGGVLPWLVGLLAAIPPAVAFGFLGGGWVRRRFHRLVLVSSDLEVQVFESENGVLVSDVLESVEKAVGTGHRKGLKGSVGRAR